MESADALNLCGAFFARVQKSPHKTAVLKKRQGQWIPLTWKQVEEKVFSYAQVLQKAGVKEGTRVAIFAATCPEWTYSDLAAISLRAVTVPVYSSVTEEDVYEILSNSEAEVVLVENANLADKVRTVIGRLPKLKTLFSFSTHVDDEVEKIELSSKAVLKEFADKEALNARIEIWRQISVAVPTDELVSIVYTSGTLGKPKGAELTHANFLANVRNITDALKLGESDTFLYFLPAAHIMGRIEQMASFYAGFTLAFAESLNHLTDNLLEVRPTILVSVPRVFEKIYTTIQSRSRSNGRVGHFAFEQAVDFGAWAASHDRRGKKMPRAMGLLRQGLDFAFFKKLRDRFGGRLRFCVSGGAPLNAEMAKFFSSAGITLLEGYGLTETTGPIFVNRPDNFVFGSVGLPFKNVEHRFDQDGELWVRGPMLFRSYHRAQQLDTEVFREGQWFTTGDIGHVDERGFLFITDRKKDILVTAGGKNIAPQKIENLFKEDALFSHVLVVGEGKKYLGALVTLNSSEAKRLAVGMKIPFENFADIVKNPSFVSLVKERIDRVNRQLASYETLKRFKILERDFSIEAGELTPSMKVRRRFCFDKYQNQIRQLFEGET